MVDNYLEFYKESYDDPYFVEQRGQDKIFAHRLCAEASVSRKFYSMGTINAAFENGYNKENFLGKVTSLIYALQKSIDEGFNNSPLASYPHAEKDYPKLYEKILEGFSSKALEKMSQREQDYGKSVYPSNLGEIVAEKIKLDKEAKAKSGPAKHIKNFPDGGINP